MKRRTLLGAALAGAVVTPALASGTARAADPGPSLTLTGTTTLDTQAIYFVSYDGLVNNNAFQKNGLLTHKGYQYAAWYTADRNAVVGRRALGAITWSTLKVGHTLRYNDSHNVISMGISKVDGRLHLNMDSHSDGFTYIKSVAGLVDNPAGLSWTASRFGAPQSTLDGLALTSQFTYPQFVSTPRADSSSATASPSPATAATPSPSTTVRPGRIWGSGAAPPAPTPASTAPRPPATCTCTASTTTGPDACTPSSPGASRTAP